MSNVKKKLMIRVITKRMKDGESFDEIIADYPQLTDAEIADLRAEFE